MSFPKYPAYKPSGVEWLGDVPAHWDLMQLRRCVQLNPSKSEISARDRADEVSFLPMEAVGDDGRLDLSRTRPISEVESGYTYFREGDVTVAKITPCFENGKGALMVDLIGGLGFGTTELIVARPISKRINSAFLNWIFRSPNFRREGEASMYGAGGQKRVPDDFVRELLWAIPTKDEQSAIATFLDHETVKIDALIAEQEKLIALLAEKRQATISHAVTRGLNPDAPMKDSGVAWLGEVPGHWEVAPLKRFWTVTDCKHITAEFVEDGFPLASIREVQSTFVQLDDAKRTTQYFYQQLIEGDRKPKTGDLIFSRNATVGEVAQVTADHPLFAMGQDVCLLRKADEEYSSDFLQAVIRSVVVIEQLKNIMVGSTFKRVNVEEIRGLSIPMPPSGEQDEIAKFIDIETTRLDALRAEAERAIALLKERRSAVIAAAVTGQIDVRGWSAN